MKNKWVRFLVVLNFLSKPEIFEALHYDFKLSPISYVQIVHFLGLSMFIKISFNHQTLSEAAKNASHLIRNARKERKIQLLSSKSQNFEIGKKFINNFV